MACQQCNQHIRELSRVQNSLHAAMVRHIDRTTQGYRTNPKYLMGAINRVEAGIAYYLKHVRDMKLAKAKKKLGKPSTIRGGYGSMANQNARRKAAAKRLHEHRMENYIL